MKDVKLVFLGLDSWSRPIYEDENGRLWKDIEPRKAYRPNLCTSVNNAFDGEPDMPMSAFKEYSEAKINFASGRITWD